MAAGWLSARAGSEIARSEHARHPKEAGGIDGALKATASFTTPSPGPEEPLR